MGIDKITVGEARILSISDCEMPVDACDFFPGRDIGSFQGFERYVDEDCSVRGGINVACFLIESKGRRILVDAGLGPGPVAEAGGARGGLIRAMRRGGIDPDDIDTVVVTHLHFDHIGWLVGGGEGAPRPTFPNAKYVIPRADWQLLFDADAAAPATGAEPYATVALEIFRASLKAGAGLRKLDNVELIDGETEITDEVTVVPTPGHTPGHVSVAVRSQGQRAYILGDVAHLPMQVQVPAWTTKADIQPELGKKTRAEALETLRRQRVIVAAGHFPAPGFGHIAQNEGGTPYWRPLGE